MCLAVPARVQEIHGDEGTVEWQGTKVQGNFCLLDDVSPGDYVLIHAGFAIQKYQPEEAQELMELWRKVSEGAD